MQNKKMNGYIYKRCRYYAVLIYLRDLKEKKNLLFNTEFIQFIDHIWNSFHSNIIVNDLIDSFQ